MHCQYGFPLKRVNVRGLSCGVCCQTHDDRGFGDSTISDCTIDNGTIVDSELACDSELLCDLELTCDSELACDVDSELACDVDIDIDDGKI